MDIGGSPRCQDTMRGAPAQTRRKYGQVESSDDDLDEDNASKQGRKNDKTNLMLHESGFDGFNDEIVDAAITGVSTTSAPVTTAGVAISTVEPRTPPTTTTVFNDEDVTIAMAQTLIKMKEEKAKEKGVAFKDVEDSSKPVRSITTLQPLPSIDPKDKGKGILVKGEPVKVKRKDQGLAQIENDAELANILHEEELAKIERIQKEKATQEEVLMATIYEDEVNYEPLSRRFPIMNWEYKLLGNVDAKDMYVCKLTKAYGSLSYHGDMQAFLRRLDRQDLNDLYRLVQERFQDYPLEGHDLLLWGDLRMLFDLDEKDELWMNQLDWKLLK
ncbi:hypothetical protein Tco_0169164 [Tanacetum coccineum]